MNRNGLFIEWSQSPRAPGDRFEDWLVTEVVRLRAELAAAKAELTCHIDECIQKTKDHIQALAYHGNSEASASWDGYLTALESVREFLVNSP